MKRSRKATKPLRRPAPARSARPAAASRRKPPQKPASRSAAKGKVVARRQSEAESSQAVLRHWREAVPNDRLAHLVKDATRALVRALQLRLAGHAVSFGHWTFLRILWEGDGLTQHQLSVEAGVMEPTTFTAVKAMEKLGYVVRRQAPENRKNVYIYLTPRGRALKKKLVPLAEEVNRVAVRGLKPAEVAAIRHALLAIIENLAEDEAAFARMERRIPSTRALSRLVSRAAE